MSHKSKKKKTADGRRAELRANYNRQYHDWLRRKPSWWRIFARAKWKAECPEKPKWMDEYDELCDEYRLYKYGKCWTNRL